MFIRRLGSFNPLFRPEDLEKIKKEKEDKELDPGKLSVFKANVLEAIDDILEEFDMLTEQINEYVTHMLNFTNW